jgi:hypothetical protein
MPGQQSAELAQGEAGKPQHAPALQTNDAQHSVDAVQACCAAVHVPASLPLAVPASGLGPLSGGPASGIGHIEPGPYQLLSHEARSEWSASPPTHGRGAPAV